jgi:hypothetical protein
MGMLITKLTKVKDRPDNISVVYGICCIYFLLSDHSHFRADRYFNVSIDECDMQKSEVINWFIVFDIVETETDSVEHLHSFGISVVCTSFN